jgi:hypothetical protein
MTTNINKQLINSTMNKYSLHFSTEYYQFYLLDEATKSQTDDADFWNSEAEKLRLAVLDGLLGVTIATYGQVNGELIVLQETPPVQSNADHVVEASLELGSGRLLIKNCTSYTTQLELDLDKGAYRIRISSQKLGTVTGDDGDDFYSIEIWKEIFSQPALLKAWQDNCRKWLI